MIPILELQQQLWQFAPKQGQTFHSIEITVPSMALLPWLSAQNQPTKLYWCNRDNSIEIAALGVCHRASRIDDVITDPKAHYLGGQAFDQSECGWQDFGLQTFILPRLALRKENNKLTLTLNLNFDKNSVKGELSQCFKLLAKLKPALAPRHFRNTLVAKQHSPTQSQWHGMIFAADAARTAGQFEKVVLSRATTLDFKYKVNPWQLLEQLANVNSNCFKFAIQIENSPVFIGCSPERLFAKSKTTLQTEALAGTVSRGNTLEQDNLLEQGLMCDPKLRHEHQIVEQYIRTTLSPVAEQLNVGQTHVIKLNQVQHLKQEITAKLKPQVSHNQLFSCLQPTPAVGGTPKTPALAFIKAHEPYQRGWYAGAVGLLTQDSSEFCVAIRSALVAEKSVQVFAGAGIVEGSVAEQEWQELNNKIKTITHLLTEPQIEKEALDVRA